jgi:hypothetical protein
MFCRHIILCLLKCVAENIQVTEGGKFVSPVLDVRRWLGSRFNRSSAYALSVGGWLGPRANLSVLEKG